MKKIFFLIIFIPVLLSANFIGMNSGARSLSMGDAFVALSDETSAIFYNPAGLSRINEFYLIASRQNLYGLSDLHNDMLAISLPTSIIQTGFAVQQISLVDAYSEKIFYFSIASTITRTNIPIRFGASFKYESIKVENYKNVKDPANFDMDLGILIDLSKNLFLGYSAQYLLEPEFKFISEAESIDRKETAGVCYRWKESVNFLADHIWVGDDTQWNFGSEIWFYDIFAARLGVLDNKLTAGFGLSTKTWTLDTAVLAHNDLGSTYRISFGYSFGGLR